MRFFGQSFVALLLIASFNASVAQGLDPRQLALIREQAAFICDTVREAKGSKTSVQIQGEISARLSGFAKRLTDLGISGGGNFNEEKFEGLSQEATAAAFEGDRGCRERVFNKMFDRIEPLKDRKASYLDAGRRNDLRAIQQYLRYAPVTVVQANEASVCQMSDQESNTQEFRLIGNQLTITNKIWISGERCTSGPQARRETTRVCTASLQEVDDVVQIWSHPSVKFSCLSGDCFKCTEQGRWTNKYKGGWISDSREYEISDADLYVGGEEYVRSKMQDFKGLTRSFARLISSGSDDAFCKRYGQYCR